MYLRLSAGQARFRVSAVELKRLLAEGILAEKVDFPGNGSFEFAIGVAENSGIQLEGGRVQFSIARSSLERLAVDPREIFEIQTPDAGLRILLDVDRFNPEKRERREAAG